MSVTFYGAGERWEVNLSNTNARQMLERLGYDELWGEVQADEFLGRVLVANVGRDDSGMADVVTVTPGRATFVECGVRPGYFADVAGRLADLATEAGRRGFTVAWG